jgi:hypothetical protein
VLGDFLVEDSLEWGLGEVNLHLADGKPKTVNSLYSVTYGPKPEIKVAISHYCVLGTIKLWCSGTHRE